MEAAVRYAYCFIDDFMYDSYFTVSLSYLFQ